MKTNLKLILAAGIGLGALVLAANSAPAMPMSGLDPAPPSDTASSVEKVRLVCGPYGCHRVHGWRRRYWWGPGYGYWGPAPWWRWGYGYYPWWPTVGFWPYYYGYYW